MASPPLRTSARSAYLISNAQVTAGASRSIRRPRRAGVLRTMATLVRDGQAVATGPLRAARPLHGTCESPVHLEELGGKANRPILDTYVRCRKCPACLKHRRAVWAARARQRIAAHSRTWMVTLTAAPDAHFRMLCEAEVAARHSGVNPSEWSEAELFAARWRQFGLHVTKWLKRIRSAGSRFVYLQVVEAHASGLPHVHLLVHEVNTVTYRALTSGWKLGFAHAKLVEGPKAALYVTKYLMKSAMARVRASQDY